MLLERSASLRGDWMHGNAIFSSHFVLGSLALWHGDLPKAEEHLLAAAPRRARRSSTRSART
jgi:hypothetical protein